ncbi:hypothetical protein [Umezawaea sp. Da 62-37]|uniref:hypothetical protein n=1 Tax=Umezawaea sp. Da 62-37 TaxID=3075927 RepID=UPI0037DC6FB2
MPDARTAVDSRLHVRPTSVLRQTRNDIRRSAPSCPVLPAHNSVPGSREPIRCGSSNSVVQHNPVFAVSSATAPTRR